MAGGQRQVRRGNAEPLLAVFLGHAVFHRVTDLVAGEVQVLQHQVIGDAQIFRHAPVAQVLHAVAAHAVVDEQLGTVLQAYLVLQVHRCVHYVFIVAAAGGERHHRQAAEKHYRD